MLFDTTVIDSRFSGNFLRNGSQMDINRIQSLLNRSNESFADALKAARLDQQVADLASAVNVSKSAWYRWEAGETLPEHRDQVEAIATALRLSLNDRMRLFRAYFRDLVRFALNKAGVQDDEGAADT